MDVGVRAFYDSIKLQLSFLEDVKKIDIESVDRIADAFVDYLTSDITHRNIHILSKGRSDLSTQSFLQGLYNVTFKVSENYRFYPSTLRDGVLKYISGSSLCLIASGSGKTKEVNRYLESAIGKDARLVLITGNDSSPAYKMVTEAGGDVLLLKSHSKYSEDVEEATKSLSPLGSEFELKTWLFLNSLVPEIRTRLQGNVDHTCPEYRKRLGVFEENARLLADSNWIDDAVLADWIEGLTNRHGLFTFYGVSRSGHVAEQFEMRFAHANKKVFMYDDSNRKPFRAGDAGMVLSGSGNTEDVLDMVTNALGLTEEGDGYKITRTDRDMVQVFGLTMNSVSKLTRALETRGQVGNLLVLPMNPEYKGTFLDSTSNSIISPSDIDIFRTPIFETSAYMVSNAIVAQVGHNDGIIPHIYFGKEHV